MEVAVGEDSIVVYFSGTAFAASESAAVDHVSMIANGQIITAKRTLVVIVLWRGRVCFRAFNIFPVVIGSRDAAILILINIVVSP